MYTGEGRFFDDSSSLLLERIVTINTSGAAFWVDKIVEVDGRGWCKSYRMEKPILLLVSKHDGEAWYGVITVVDRFEILLLWKS